MNTTSKHNRLGGFCETCGGTGRTESGCQPCPVCTKHMPKNEARPVNTRLGERIRREAMAHVELDVSLCKAGIELNGAVAIRLHAMLSTKFNYTDTWQCTCGAFVAEGSTCCKS